MNTLHIRRYQSSDHDTVVHLHRLALEQLGAFLNNPAYQQDLLDIEKSYLNSGGEFLVGELDGEIVAMGAFRKITPEKAEIKRMRVHPDHQRKGFGQLIYNQLEQTARQMGYKILILDTSTKQIPAQKFYLKNGYQEIQRIKKELELIIYEKILT